MGPVARTDGEQAMDPLLEALLNFGGMGLLAAAILWLHREALKAFREEMAAERTSCDRRHVELVGELKEIVKEGDRRHLEVVNHIQETRHAVKDTAQLVSSDSQMTRLLVERLLKPTVLPPPP